ncbi:Imidazolonepropionase [Cnuella takakiae]|uniref:Imidazolonepropionase n=1 Tax=Cnuella takakiae TaxID=1302690 RepID=A0A1M5EGW5_9BACT|nr:amidohydrolase family protein [Cnuella takakiae]OLY91169.1 hypothetical protein BUE76_04090 [Cnuella takakiae]SHF78301.1 Imidazolonepropionase [Cnuella takakiae]
MKPILILVLLLSAATIHAQQSILIKAGKMYNAEQNRFETNRQILLSNGRIEKVGANLTAPAGATIIDCPSCTVTPGLIDMHTHILYKEDAGDKSVLEDGINHTDADRSLRAVKIANTLLKGGFTTIRDLGNSGVYLDVSFRNAVRAGNIQGPRVFASGPILSPVGGQTYNLPMHAQHLVAKEYRVINGPVDARLAVQEHVRMGVDLIKVCSDNTPGNLLLSPDELKAIVQTAQEYGLPVTAHATFDRSVRQAVLAGVNGIEHGYSIADSTLELMKQRKVYLVPTDMSYEGAMTLFRLQKVEQDTNYVHAEINAYKSRLMRAYKKGIPIVFGRDYYFNTGLNEAKASIDGLSSYFQAGMPAHEVLRTATWNAASALGRQGQLGVLKEGATADIVVFDGDLETNFLSAIQKTKWVIKSGVIVQ